MAQTAAQKAAAAKQLAATQQAAADAARALQKKYATPAPVTAATSLERFKAAEAGTPLPAPVKATTPAPSAADVQAAADAAWATTKVGTTGKTQAQIDAALGATTTVDLINANSASGVTAKIDPKTGMIGLTSISTGLPYVTPSQAAANAAASAKELAENPVYAALLAQFSVYGIEGLGDSIAKIRMDYPDITSEDLLTLLRSDSRYNAGYLKRFAGNKALTDQGLLPLSEKEYLANEQSYKKLFTTYSLPQFTNQAQYAKLIGGLVSPTEAGTRVSMAYDRILNADPNALAAFKKYYPSLSTGDIVAAMLDPKEQLPILERKVTSAEIGGAALSQGLDAFRAATTVQSQRYANITGGTLGSELLAASGETLPMAKADYAKIAAELPTMEKISAISGTNLAQYGQVEAEQANILGLASANRAKQAQIEAENARWQGSAGAAAGAFSTGYLKKATTAGLI